MTPTRPTTRRLQVKSKNLQKRAPLRAGLFQVTFQGGKDENTKTKFILEEKSDPKKTGKDLQKKGDHLDRSHCAENQGLKKKENQT